MRQWTAAKGENPDTLLFFRMGDFYELFYDDAVLASRLLQITLTARNKEKGEPVPIDPERWTNNTKAAFSAATGHAASSNNPELTPAHLLDALLQQQETMTRPLLAQVGVDPDTLAGKVQEQLSRLPRAQGGAEPGLSREAREVLEAAEK